MNEAEIDLRNLLSPIHQAQHVIDEIKGQRQINPLHINLNFFEVVPSNQRGNPDLTQSDHNALNNLIDAQINTANQVFNQIDVTVRKNPNNQAITTICADPNGTHENYQSSILVRPNVGPDSGKFNAGYGSQNLKNCLTQQNLNQNTVDIAFVPGFEAAMAANGYTIRKSARPAPTRPICVLSKVPALGNRRHWLGALAHELGHALTESGQHSTETQNLMAAGINRSLDDEIGTGQQAAIRNSQYCN